MAKEKVYTGGWWYVDFTLPDDRPGREYQIEIIPRTTGGFLTQSTIRGFEVQTTSYGSLGGRDITNYLNAMKKAVRKAKSLDKQYKGAIWQQETRGMQRVK